MTSTWQPYREPLRTTLIRTVAIAVVVGALLSWRAGALSRWPFAALLVLWASFGGHWVEIWFLNWLRPRLPGKRALQVLARFAVWFAGGIVLSFAMKLTAWTLTESPPDHWPVWWLGGVAFIVIELIAHLSLQLLGRPSFYNGRG